VPLGVVIADGTHDIPIRDDPLERARRLGLPKLPHGALQHIKYPVTNRRASLSRATGFAHASTTRGGSFLKDAFLALVVIS